MKAIFCKDFFVTVLFVFVVRLLLSFLPSFSIDMGTWISWSGRLSSLGFAEFYSDSVWTQYTPGFLYWLWLVGKAGWFNELIVKIPIIFADIGVGMLIWSLIVKKSKKVAVISFLLYSLNPIVIFTGSVWGQIDGILTFFLFLSAYVLVEKGKIFLSYAVWAVAFLIKPQAIAILPVILAISLIKHPLKKVIISTAILPVILLLGSFVFFPNNPFWGFPQLLEKMLNSYSYTSLFAYNVWSLVGFWITDANKFIGIAFNKYGLIFTIIACLVVLIHNFKKFGDNEKSYIVFALFCLIFFLFPTRVHERYLFPFFAFLLAGSALSKFKRYLGIYILVSLFHLVNLYYPYAYYTNNFLRSETLMNLSVTLAKPIAFVLLIIFFVLLFWEKVAGMISFDSFWKKVRMGKILNVRSEKIKFPKIALSTKALKIVLLGILVFALATRIIGLGNPKNEYFDEVYHAFTARLILHGDPKAWEWWNPHPEGFAYEWTHPPLAKLGMVLGMKIFGENSFGWRFPGVLLGVGSVFLVFLLAAEIFKDRLVGVLSAAVYCLDGLSVVMSRIGMNDSYLLFFSLLSIYLFIKKQNYLSAFSFGLALASKWSAVWVIPILFVLWLSRKKKISAGLLWFLFLPPIIYLACYAPMFWTGHNLNIFWEMQKQMWWYHTGLKATHPYTSAWWSWPLLIRPVYLYTSDEIGGLVARIYATGNPAVFWFGLVGVVYSFFCSFYEKNKKLALVVFSYLIFFVPWAVSPRIMFLYHYLPALPFLAIASGCVLRRSSPKLTVGLLAIGLLVFIYFYPHWAGLQVPLWLDKSYYWLLGWR